VRSRDRQAVAAVWTKEDKRRQPRAARSSAATLVCGRATVNAQLIHVDGRLLRFEVTALDESAAVVAHGQIPSHRRSKALPGKAQE
jgi:hypothetical protein